MNQKELKELIEFLVEKDIAEFELERGDVEIRMKRRHEAPPPAQHGGAAPAGTSPARAPAPVRPVEAASAPGIEAGVEAPDEAGLHLLRSPIVGTFYESPSPGAAAFVKPGDHVTAGQVVCIIEAMKLMNEIEADATGEIVKRYVANAQPVEYGQPLFSIRATG